jgi:hypothetical protein
MVVQCKFVFKLTNSGWILVGLGPQATSTLSVVLALRSFVLPTQLLAPQIWNETRSGFRFHPVGTLWLHDMDPE